jgi:pro-apoptotic serine protease NMA111
VIVHVDERIGLVLVDRNTVCIAAGDILVSFCAFPAEAPAAVRFLHPLHNWAIVSFDVADLPLEVETVALRPCPYVTQPLLLWRPSLALQSACPAAATEPSVH